MMQERGGEEVEICADARYQVRVDGAKLRIRRRSLLEQHTRRGHQPDHPRCWLEVAHVRFNATKRALCLLSRQDL